MNRVAARALLRRLVEVVPVAWRQDRVFRYAVIGAGITLVVVLGRPGASRQDRPLPPLATLPAGMPTVLPALPGMAPPTQTAPVQVPKIAPGQSLGDVTVAPALNGDRFGTFKPGPPP